jgi:hypothetical protein
MPAVMRTWNRTAVVVVPKQPFLEWLQSVDEISSTITLEDLAKEPTVYLLPETGSDLQAERRLAEVCHEIFEEELNGWYCAPATMAFRPGQAQFSRWFAYSIHSMIVDLCDNPLVSEEL